jgi:hypothetical protein
MERMRVSRLAPWAVAIVAGAFGVWAEHAVRADRRPIDWVAGATLAAAGAVVWRRGRRWAGAWFGMASCTWFAADVGNSRVMVYLHRPVILTALAVLALWGVPASRARSAQAALTVMWAVWTIGAVVGVGLWVVDGWSVTLVAVLFAAVWAAVGSLRPTRELVAWCPALVWVCIQTWMSRPPARALEWCIAACGAMAMWSVGRRLDPSRGLAVDLGLMTPTQRDDARLDVVHRAERPTADSSTTVLDLDAEHLLVVRHTSGTVVDDELRDDLLRSGRLMLARRQREFDVDARTAEVSRSQARLASATDLERERFAGDLQTSVVPHLDRLAELLRAARGVPPEVLASLRSDVDGLAGASNPTALADGLVAAVRGAVASSAVPAHLEVAVAAPALPSVEAAVWFTLAEALTNVARHSAATSVSVDLLLGPEVVLRVTDNGVGGASEHAGSGIAGLRARAQSLGGQLLVRSRRGEGTELWLRLPNAPEGGDR